MSGTAHHIGPDSAPDRYRLLRSIGRGGEAVLYLAEIELAGGTEPVVVKVLDSRTTITPEIFERVSDKWNEQAELLRFVSRPGVVGVREHFQGPPIHRPGESGTLTGRALVLVMNHVDGLDLRDWRAERTLATPAERREVMRALEQLADVLDWLHSGKATPSGRTVVHGDLSPGNVMVDEHGQATLVDFGLSKLTADHQTAEVWFTPGYAAPEIFDGKRTPATDRYAFGAIAYFLLSGQAPPAAPEQLSAALAALPHVAGLPEDQRTRVLSIAAADPGRRPVSLSGWVKDVRHGVVSTTTTSRPATVRDAVPPRPVVPPASAVPAGPSSAQPVRRGRKGRVIGAVAGVVLIAVLAVMVVQLLGDRNDDGKGGQAAPPAGASTSVTTEATTEPTTEPPTEQPTGTDSADPSASETATPSAEDSPEQASLTAYPAVDMEGFEPGTAALAGEYVPDALRGVDFCQGKAVFNLAKNWSKLSLLVGIDNDAKTTEGRVDIVVDGKSLFGRTVFLGAHEKLNLDVKDGLRLEISYDQGACKDSGVVIGNPVLSR
ncbi:serine/threonine-protein kinase [Streptomyces sp. NPDC005828]|uniref:serine/threonine protein kinase n=1 Tax=Streptomyces sp. NPDC005828 TaxID=3157071 RepID=UPI0034048590